MKTLFFQPLPPCPSYAQMAEEVKDCVWKCLVTEKEAMELNKNYIVSNLKNQGERVELRIVSKEKPTD